VEALRAGTGAAVAALPQCSSGDAEHEHAAAGVTPSAAEAELTQRGEHLLDGRAEPRLGAAGSTPAASDDIGVDSEGGDLGGETSVLVGNDDMAGGRRSGPACVKKQTRRRQAVPSSSRLGAVVTSPRRTRRPTHFIYNRQDRRSKTHSLLLYPIHRTSTLISRTASLGLEMAADTSSNGRQGEAAGDGGAPKLHHMAAFGRGLLGLAAASTAITLVVTEPPAWLDRNAYFTVLRRDHPGDRGRRTTDGEWRGRISSAGTRRRLRRFVPRGRPEDGGG
jgi:hypothetical protein